MRAAALHFQPLRPGACPAMQLCQPIAGQTAATYLECREVPLPRGVAVPAALLAEGHLLVPPGRAVQPALHGAMRRRQQYQRWLPARAAAQAAWLMPGWHQQPACRQNCSWPTSSMPANCGCLVRHRIWAAACCSGAWVVAGCRRPAEPHFGDWKGLLAPQAPAWRSPAAAASGAVSCCRVRPVAAPSKSCGSALLEGGCRGPKGVPYNRCALLSTSG